MELKKVEGGHMGMVKIGNPEDMANAIYMIVHHGIELVADHGDGMKCCELAGSGAMGATLNLALIICKKPPGLNPGRVPKEATPAIYKSLRTETLVFANLLVAHQFDEIGDHDEDHMTLRAKFGSDIFGIALAQWQKLYPEQKIEDYLDPAVVDIAKKALNDPENHFTSKDFDPRFLLRNNGSIN